MKRTGSNLTTVVFFRVTVVVAITIAISVVLVRSANTGEGPPNDVASTQDGHVFHRILRFRIPSAGPISKSSKTAVERKSIATLESDKGQPTPGQTVPVEPTDNRLETEVTENGPTANEESVASTDNSAERAVIAPDLDKIVDDEANTQSAGTGSATLGVSADERPLPAAELIQRSSLTAVAGKQGSDGGDALAVDTSTTLSETKEQETGSTVSEHSTDSPVLTEVKDSRPPATDTLKLVQHDASRTLDKLIDEPADKLADKSVDKPTGSDRSLPQSLIRKMLTVDVQSAQRPAISAQRFVGADDERQVPHQATSVGKARSEDQVAGRFTPTTNTPVGTANDNLGPTTAQLTAPLEPPLPRAIALRGSRGSSSMMLQSAGGPSNSAAVQRRVPAASSAAATPADRPAPKPAAPATRSVLAPSSQRFVQSSSTDREAAKPQGDRTPAILSRPSAQELATSQATTSRLKSRPVDVARPSSTPATRRTPPQPAKTKSQPVSRPPRPATQLVQRHPAPAVTRTTNGRTGQRTTSTPTAVGPRPTVSGERSRPVQSPSDSSLANSAGSRPVAAADAGKRLAAKSWTVVRPQVEPALSPVREPTAPEQATSNPDRGATVADQWIHAQPRVQHRVQISNEIVELAGKHNEYARSLASKGAVLAAQDEYVQTLRLIAQARGAMDKSERHRQALAEALVAFEEADDFAAARAVVTTDSNVKHFISAHRTPVFKQTTRERVPALEALQAYYSFAANRLSMSVGNDRVASAALCGLAQLQAVQFGTVSTERTMSAAKAIVLFQASLAADATNSLAANELGVIYTRYGRLEQAKDAFLQSTLVSNRPEPWANLSKVYTRLGNQQLAQQATDRYHAIKQAAQNEDIQIPGVNVRWVNHDAFGVRADSMGLNNASQQPTNLAVQPNAHPHPQAQTLVAGRKGGGLRTFINSFTQQQRGADSGRPAYMAKKPSNTKHPASRR